VIITAILQQARKRYQILVDGEPVLSVHEDVLVKYGLYKGIEIELDDLDEITKAQERHYVSQACFRYLSFRPRTSWEATQHLLQKGYEDQLVKQVIDSMMQRGYLDDRQYAGNWVAERQSGKKLGITRLKQELKQKGIPSTIIEEVIQMEHMDKERKLVTEVAEQRYSRLRNEEWQTIERRLGSYLLRRGFPYHMVRQTLQQIRTKHDQEE
jgi:regulatory protein